MVWAETSDQGSDVSVFAIPGLIRSGDRTPTFLRWTIDST